MSRKYLLALAFCLVAAIAVFAPSLVSAASSETCEQKVAKLNYRSELLEIYQKSENDKYTAVHKKWATRISYAGQWIPKDAEKTRESLYEYDALHAATDKEVNKQIGDYRYLEKSPLNCSKSKVATLTKKLDEVKGLKNNKVVGGNALIGQHKKAESEFLKKDFKKSSDGLIQKLHKEKSKHPKPQHPKTDVKS
ncbi:MAG: hypothetical protein JWO35_10 [Candidatus Saccharibacteria bacterium]|nr:hypothetical protein [Candidatus Saccharibacteria bacterium]